jgi:hypothetical protein
MGFAGAHTLSFASQQSGWPKYLDVRRRFSPQTIPAVDVVACV